MDVTLQRRSRKSPKTPSYMQTSRAVVRLYRRGTIPSYIGARLKISTAQVWRIIDEKGLRRKRGRAFLPPRIYQAIVTGWRRTRTLTGAAANAKVSATTARRVLASRGFM